MAPHFLISFCFCRVALSPVVPFNQHIIDVLCVLQLIVPHHSVLLSLQSKRHRFDSELFMAIFFVAPTFFFCQSLGNCLVLQIHQVSRCIK